MTVLLDGTAKHVTPMKHVARIARAYVRLAEGLGIAGILILVSVGVLQVFFRYVVGHSLFWSAEVMQYVTIWVVFLVAGLAYSRGEFLSMNFIAQMLPPAVRRVTDFLGRLVVVIMLLTIAWQALHWTTMTARTLTPALHVSIAWVRVSLPIGFLLMALHVLAGYFVPPEHVGLDFEVETKPERTP